MSGAHVPAPLAAVEAFHRKTVFSRRVQVLAARLASLLPVGRRVLDVGCGDGSIDEALRAMRPELSIEGYDVLARTGSRIPVRPFDGTNLPVPDDAADAVLLVDVLHHADDPVALLRECGRVAPTVLVKDHFAESALDRLILRFMDWVGNAPHGVVLRYHYFSRASWNVAVSAAGLRETERGDVPALYPFPFSLVFGGRLHFVARLQLSH